MVGSSRWTADKVNLIPSSFLQPVLGVSVLGTATGTQQTVANKTVRFYSQGAYILVEGERKIKRKRYQMSKEFQQDSWSKRQHVLNQEVHCKKPRISGLAPSCFLRGIYSGASGHFSFIHDYNKWALFHTSGENTVILQYLHFSAKRQTILYKKNTGW